jgi:hypothetical protein
MQVLHTSQAEAEQGQIYIPVVNWALFSMVIITVLLFRESTALAGAYGISVTTTMVITTILLSIVMHRVWKVHIAAVVVITTLFFVVDVAFLAANLMKIRDGGWFPLLLGAVGFTYVSYTRAINSKSKRKKMQSTVMEVSTPPPSSSSSSSSSGSTSGSVRSRGQSQSQSQSVASSSNSAGDASRVARSNDSNGSSSSSGRDRERDKWADVSYSTVAIPLPV